MCNSLRPHGLYPTRLLCAWDSRSKNTGGGCRALLQPPCEVSTIVLPILWGTRRGKELVLKPYSRDQAGTRTHTGLSPRRKLVGMVCLRSLQVPSAEPLFGSEVQEEAGRNWHAMGALSCGSGGGDESWGGRLAPRRSGYRPGRSGVQTTSLDRHSICLLGAVVGGGQRQPESEGGHGVGRVEAGDHL